MCITIRRATPADAGLIAFLSRQTFYDTFAVHNSEQNMQLFLHGPFATDKLEEEVSLPGNIFLLANENNTAAGYAKLSDRHHPPGLEKHKAIEICRLYATRQAIGRGVGKALMESCLQLAKEQGKAILWLGVWEQNARAIAFYTRFGFEKFGTHPFILGQDVQTDWLMKKQIW